MPSSPRPAQFDFGNVFARPPRVTLWLMIITGVASVVTMASRGAFGTGTLARLLLFSPSQVLDQWRIWTPFTYLFVAADPFGLLMYEVFGLWMFASRIEVMWGPRRFLYYFFATGAGAALLTTLFALGVPSLRVEEAAAFSGTWAVFDAILLAWILMNWHATVYLFFFPVRAPWLLVFTLAIPALYIIQGVWQPFIPVLAAMGIGYVLLSRNVSVRRAYLHLRAWWIDRQLKRRSRHLRVVPPTRGRRDDEPRGPDRYLH